MGVHRNNRKIKIRSPAGALHSSLQLLPFILIQILKNRMTVSFLAKRFVQIGLGSGIAISTLICSRPLSAMANSSSPFYDFKAIDINGVEQSLSKYAGHVCIVVNVASK